jgi:hypothetical protein
MDDHKIKNLIDMIQKSSIDAVIAFSDKDLALREELNIISGKAKLNPQQVNI